MVRTRRGRKRPSPNLLDNENEDKKLKIEQPNLIFNESEDVECIKENSCYVESNNNDAVPTSSKTLSHTNEMTDSSESSSDEFMKAPFSLDSLDTFKLAKQECSTLATDKKADFSNQSSRLSESEEETLLGDQDYYDFSHIIESQAILSRTKKELEEKAKSNETDTDELILTKNKQSQSKAKKRKDIKHNSNKSLLEDDGLEISELLAIAEGLTDGVNYLSDDHEEDLHISADNKYSIPEEGIQVTIDIPNLQKKKKSQGFDMEAAMKRRINLIRKENQVYMHKVHTLCWIAYGFFLNFTINSDDLMGLVLSLIPSTHCYPSKHADLNYLEKLVEWFKGKVNVNENHKHFLNNSCQPLKDVLLQEISMKTVFSKRDFVLLFVCMVRSLGIDARLVVSLRPVPLKPPISDLCTVRNSKFKERSDEDLSIKTTTSSNISHKDNVQTKRQRQKALGPDIKEHNSHLSKENLNISNNKLRMNNQKNKVESSFVNLSKLKTTPEPGKSVYFSSSDEISLKELQTRLKKTPNSSSKPNKKNQHPISSKDKNWPIVSKTKKMASHSKVIIDTDNINQKQGITKRISRKLASTSYEEITTSSDVEMEITQNKAKRRNISGKSSLVAQGKLDQDSHCSFKQKKTSIKKKSIDRRVLSSDEDNNISNKIGNDYWAEIFLEAEEKWISVDLNKGKVHCVHKLYNGATQPVRYIVAFNNNGTAKDVTRRYAPQWLTVTRRLRAEDSWWQETMAPYTPQRSVRERIEDEDLDRQLHDKPLPKSVAEYKNHPLYALRRHLLKFEAIYPADAPPLGFVKGEPVYSRGCVVQLHTRETWIKEAKLVRRDEEPYKVVKARPKWDKLSQKVINDLPLPLFGHWQVEDYIPPPAVDGKVPRNDYGNVELYKPCMLPPGTVHLQVPQLARVARKLGIDCAPAVVGWEFSGGGSHPVLDGFIVCEEVKELLLDAWNKEMDESSKRAKEKVEHRVYGNWKRLIRGLLIRERLKLRYDFGETVPGKKKSKKQQSKPSTSKK